VPERDSTARDTSSPGISDESSRSSGEAASERDERMSFGEVAPHAQFARRLLRLTALRLVVLTGFFAFVSFVYLRSSRSGISSTIAFSTLAGSYAVSGLVFASLRGQRLLRPIAALQLVVDQLSWTMLVYVTGGVTSAGVSLYGFTCFSGAIILGVRGGLIALGVALGAYGALAAGMVNGFLRPPGDQAPHLFVTSWTAASYPVLANVVGLTTVTGFALYLADRLRTAGGALERERARAESAEHLAALGRLSAGLAHEIRNPLGSIAGSVELLRSSPGLSEEDRHLCDIVQREAARLNELVGDMLDLARPRSLQLDSVDVVRLAREVLLLAGRSGRGEDVRVRYEGELRLLVRGDEAQLRQMLWNLVRNAMQASSGGDEVVVRVTRRREGAELAVRDQGAGIAPEARIHLFDAFFTTRSHGTGVGLAVVKQVVEAHGFHIRVGDAGGVGAEFVVRFPSDALVSDAGPEPTGLSSESASAG